MIAWLALSLAVASLAIQLVGARRRKHEIRAVLFSSLREALSDALSAALLPDESSAPGSAGS